ncbi:hypothetical protein FAVG1_08538 [Fusarium avenaceum]|nr:hypothetical protein FAVG1_08538 [Fusarium avenaceum]
MYQALAPRPKKTNITRSRSGCAPCRRKRRKCDEQKPACGRCLKTSQSCHYQPPTLDFRNANAWLSQRRSRTEQKAPVFESSASVDISSSSQQDEQDVVFAGPSPLSPFPALSPYQTPSPSFSLTWEQEKQRKSSFDHQPEATDINEPPARSEAGELVSIGSTPTTGDLPCSSDNESLPGLRSSSTHTQLIATAATPKSSVSDHTLAPILSNDLVWFDVDELGNWAAPDCGPPSSMLHSIGGVSSWSSDDLGLLLLGNSHSWNSWAPPNIIDTLPLPVTELNSNSNLPQQSPDESTLRQYSSSTLTTSLDDRRYLSHFMLDIMRSLPSPFEELWLWLTEHSLLKAAAMALSAANLGNRHGLLVPGSRGRWVPKASHARAATQYMLRCTDATASLIQRMPLFPRLALRILLVCYELEKGAIFGMRKALAAMHDEVSENCNELLSDPVGKAIASNYVLLQYLEIDSRKPHAPLGKESKSEFFISTLVPYLSTAEFIARTIGHRACRASWRIIFLNCIRAFSETPAKTVERMGQWWSLVMGGQRNDNELENDYLGTAIMGEEELLSELKAIQDALAECSPPQGMQHLGFNEVLVAGSPMPTSDDLHHIPSRDFQDTMICAEYAFAKLVSDGSFLYQLTMDKSSGRSGAPAARFDPAPMAESPWLRVLFKIAYGLDPVNCQRHNGYRMGIISMLMARFFLGAGRVALDCLDDFLRRAASAGVQYEGPFSPTEASWMLSRTLRREMDSSPERTIFMAAMMVDPGASEPLFSKDVSESILMCGREANGRYFHDIALFTRGDED